MTIVFSESAQKERGPAFKSGSEPAILAALPIACVVCDAAGAVVWHNAAAARLFAGVLAPGRLLLELLRPEIPAAVDALLSHLTPYAAKPETPGDARRYFIDRPDGLATEVEVSIEPLPVEADATQAAVLCFREIRAVTPLLRDSGSLANAVVETTTECVKVVDADGFLIQMNPAGLRMIEATDTIIGSPVLNLIAPEHRDSWQKHHRRVCAGESVSWSFDLVGLRGTRRHVEAHSTPIRVADGRVAHLAITRDVTLRRSQEAELLQRERWFRGLLEGLPVAVYTTDPDGRVTYYNGAAADLWGHRPPLYSTQWCGSWRLFSVDGAPMAYDECPMALALKQRRPIRNVEAICERPDGTRIPFMPYPTPIYDEDGNLLGAVNMLVDISHHKAAAKHQQLMINELNHRVKNTLATVQSIAAQTLKGRIDPPAQQQFESRLLALSKAHDVLTVGQWKRASLADLVERAMAPLAEDDADRLVMSGPHVLLMPKMALSLAMALHELLTNAVKYGSLSVPGGAVHVGWHTVRNAQGERLHLEWREAGGPPVAPPTSRGFGSRMIEQGLAHELHATIALEFRPTGLLCTIDAPIPEQQQDMP